MTTFFEQPSNGYRVKVSDGACFLWTLLFGVFFFLVRGSVRHFVISLILAICTCGFSWLIYPFFSSSILRTMYLERGYREVRTPAPDASGSSVIAPIFLLLLAGVGAFWWFNSRHNQVADTPRSAANTGKQEKMSIRPKEVADTTTPHVAAQPVSVPATKSATPEPLIPMRTWTDKQHRKLEASLVEIFTNSSGADEGFFKKPDGEMFRYAIDKLSSEDVQLVKHAIGRVEQVDTSHPLLQAVALVSQVTREGLLVQFVGTLDDSGVHYGRGRPLISDERYFLVGHPWQSRLVDGDPIHAVVVEEGVYEYKSVLGANKRVRKYRVMEPNERTR